MDITTGRHHGRSTAPALGRRQFLQAGGLGGLALGLPQLFQAQAAPRAPRPDSNLTSIRSCILLFYYGGPSHLDTFDMKPTAPAEIRGEFRPIATSLTGLRV